MKIMCFFRMSLFYSGLMKSWCMPLRSSLECVVDGTQKHNVEMKNQRPVGGQKNEGAGEGLERERGGMYWGMERKNMG